MRIRLGQLEALVWIARLGSFRAAARRLNISQPAISGRIRALETQLRIVVLDRSQSRPRITRQGTEVVRYAEQMLDLSETFAVRMRASHSLVGTIRMGAADSFALTHLSALLARIAAKHPAAHVELDVDFSVNLDRKLRAAELDIAFLNSPTPDPSITIVSLMDIELGWFASPTMRLPRGHVTPGQLVRIPILSNPRTSHMYRSIIDWFGAAGLTPQRLNTCTSLSIMAKLTVDGFGVSVLPDTLVRAELKSGALRRLKTSPELRPHHLTVAYRNDPGIGDLANIVDLIREQIGIKT
jgi:DNA-binding transcriptional LysR family regulator